MPKHSEKKYKVEDFDSIIKLLSDIGATIGERSVSEHYYAKQDSLDVTKLVCKDSGCAIHVLKEDEGTFALTENVSVDDKDAGLAWLRDHGFEDVMLVKMDHVDYEHAGGIVGLYIINDDLYSAILDFPIEEHDEMASLFGLDDAEVIEQPYNVYLSES